MWCDWERGKDTGWAWKIYRESGGKSGGKSGAPLNYPKIGSKAWGAVPSDNEGYIDSPCNNHKKTREFPLNTHFKLDLSGHSSVTNFRLDSARRKLVGAIANYQIPVTSNGQGKRYIYLPCLHARGQI